MADDVSGRLVRAQQPQLPATPHWEYVPTPPATKLPMERSLAVLRRFKWLILLVTMLATVGGFAAMKLVNPKYRVMATIWIQSQSQGADAAGPIRSGELLNSSAWIELLRSYRIADAVVRDLKLYVVPQSAADSIFFRDFNIADKFTPGTYELKMDRAAQRWTLAGAGGPVADAGNVADSIGRKLGLRWVIAPEVFNIVQQRDVRFTVSTPREAAVALTKRLDTKLPEKSNFLALSIEDQDPAKAQRVLNAWAHEFVQVAGELKKTNVVQFANTLSGQLRFAEASLQSAEQALERFRVNTITLPAEGGPVAGGIEITRDPSLKSFFEQKIAFDDVRNDREALEKIIVEATAGRLPWEAALLIPGVAQGPGADELREAFRQLQLKQADLAAKRQIYTEQSPTVRDALAAINLIQRQTIPQAAARVVAQMRQREGYFGNRISTASRDLQAIPARTIEEARLRRSVSVAEGLYTTLKSRSSSAELAEASSTPDISLLDSAIAPLSPTNDTGPKLLVTAIIAGLAAAIGLAFLLDRLDKTIRYPDQVRDELGLYVVGAIPFFPKGAASKSSPEQLSHLVEAVRTVRMHVLNNASVPLSVAVSSPSPGDGKTFLSVNLAMSLADAGISTVLVDGDSRRGTLHEFFSMQKHPGLTDYLLGLSSLDSVIHQTDNERLSIIPAGKRQPRHPELISSGLLPKLRSDLLSRFDAVIFDTPPLAAGIDAYAIASAATNLLLVVRIGKTKRRLAAAKVALIDQLPVRIFGAVLNCVQIQGEFDSYGYAAYGYELNTEEEDHAPALIP